VGALKGFVRIVSSRVGPDAVIFDVGANIGLTSIAMAVACPIARIFAFEGSPSNAAYLRWNTAAVENITVVEAAVSDRSRTLMFASTYGAGSHVLGSGHIDDTLPTVAVEAISLDQFAEAHNLAPALIKIDVEGHEPEVLAGSRRIMETFHPWLCMEFNSWTLNAFGGHSPAAFVPTMWDAYDIEGQPAALSFLHTNMITNQCVDDVVMRLQEGRLAPTLAEMSYSPAARAEIARLVAHLA